MKFSDMELAPELLRTVAELGYDEPTPIQSLAIPHALLGKDVLGRAQTGTGKTAAFMLPTLHQLREGDGLRALVLCPTRELAIQVADSAREYAKHLGLFVGVLYGGVPVQKDLRDLRAGFDVLVATPGRLLDHLDRGNVDLRGLKVLILDEADRMLDMGFKPQIDRMLGHCPKVRQTLFFSATLPTEVRYLASRMLQEPVTVEAAPHVTTAETVQQFVYPVSSDRKTALLLELLARPGMDSVLIFTRTKFGADRLAGQLERAGIGIEVMHGDRDMKARTRALDQFASGNTRVLVATDVAQRGLDVEGVSHVINYDAPQDPDGYVHRIGRTGRAGQTGEAITFMSGGEIGDVRAVEALIGREIPRVILPEYAANVSEADAAFRVPSKKQNEKPVKAARGRRFGARAGQAMSDEQRADLMKQG